jgi:hypothetical protein
MAKPHRLHAVLLQEDTRDKAAKRPAEAIGNPNLLSKTKSTTLTTDITVDKSGQR